MTTPAERSPTALRSLLHDATTYATEFLEEIPERRVAPTTSAEDLRKELGGPLPDRPRDPAGLSRSSRGRSDPDSWLRLAAASSGSS
jgi:hypothetical protein